MPSKDLIQVVAYIAPELKKLADQRISQSEARMTMSSYIAMLIKRDLLKRKAA